MENPQCSNNIKINIYSRKLYDIVKHEENINAMEIRSIMGKTKFNV